MLNKLQSDYRKLAEWGIFHKIGIPPMVGPLCGSFWKKNETSTPQKFHPLIEMTFNYKWREVYISKSIITR